MTRPPFETFKEATCKGSYILGSACGTCEKCAWERAQIGYDPFVSSSGKPIDMANEINWKARAELMMDAVRTMILKDVYDRDGGYSAYKAWRDVLAAYEGRDKPDV